MSDTNNGGIGFVGLLTIVLIVLKLTNYITWSWLWVLSPIWISLILFIAVTIIGIVIVLIIILFAGIFG